MDLQKVKEALIAAQAELPELSSAPIGKEPQAIRASRLVTEALAVLEKPTSENEIEELANALDGWNRAQWSFRHIAHDLCEYWGIRGTINFGSYHDKKCAECKHTVWCSHCGDPITIGVCENCVPDMFDNNHKPI